MSSNPSDFQQLAAMGPAGGGDGGDTGYDPRFGQELQKAMAPQMDSFRQLGANLGVANEAQQTPIPPSKVAFNPQKGTVSITDMSQQAYEGFLRDQQQLNQIRGSFAMEAERLRQREQQVREQSPWIQLATALAANMAQAKDLPGWVQAAGRTSAQLNPQPDEIRNQRLGVLGKEAEITERGAGLNIAQARTLQEAQGQRQTLAQHIETQRASSVEHALDNLSQSIGKGPGQMDAKSAAAILVAAGATPKEVEVKLEQLKTLAGNVGKAFEIHREDVAAAQKLALESEDRRSKSTAAYIASVGAKAGEKSDTEAALEATAQSIAKGDLTSIRDVASLRSDQRLKLYARAKELNPDFSVAETNRKIDTEKAFTTGKEGDALKSFDTFLQHAGEAAEAFKRIEQTNTPLLNKSLNWWRKNMAGTPELAQLETSLEPVGKEFEKFLVGGGALYLDDRKKIDAIVNPNLPLKTAMATLAQMGVTVKDRFTAMNQRYKRVMKKDIENPLSEEGLAAASRIGVDLGIKAPATTGKTVNVSADELEKLKQSGFK